MTFVDDGKSQEQLEAELGSGVQKDPVLPPKPKLEQPSLDLSQAFSVDALLEEIGKLGDPKRAEASIEKTNKYEEVAKQIWTIKQAANEVFYMDIREIEQTVENDGIIKYIWKRDTEGKIIAKPKKFYYSGMTIQEKDKIFQLVADRESASFDLNRMADRIKEVAKKTEETETGLTDAEKEILNKKEWVTLARKYNKANQDYYTTRFATYFGATEDDMERMDFNDIVNYGEVGAYKEGIKSPLYVER